MRLCASLFTAENSFACLDALPCIDVGKSGRVYALDSRRVMKKYEDSSDPEVRIERQAYTRLGRHPNIAKFLGALEDNSIILERGRVLRDLLSQGAGVNSIPLATRYQWIKQAATGLRYIHNHGIVQSDVGCRNMIITNGTLKLIDFEGCSIDGEEPYSSYEWFSYKPSTPYATIKTDIFALGCVIYEIISGRPPYYELKGIRNARGHVEHLYECNQFPDVSQLPMGDLMSGCWHGKFDSMREVLERIKQFEKMEPLRQRHTWWRVVAAQSWLGRSDKR